MQKGDEAVLPDQCIVRQVELGRHVSCTKRPSLLKMTAQTLSVSGRWVGSMLQGTKLSQWFKRKQSPCVCLVKAALQLATVDKLALVIAGEIEAIRECLGRRVQKPSLETPSTGW
jgi:hypothetical protein